MTATITYQYKRLGKFLSILALSTATVITSGQSFAISSDYDAIPPTIQSGSANTDPLVMLTMSNDHQLYIKAYTDYTDLDGDGTIDKDYTDSFDYYGYFDSKRCYSYGSGQFTPTATAGVGTYSHHCPSSSHWSGNFLNWATMTRMDVIRKVLFGGKRYEDEPSSTILERALIPTDVHAFVKTYDTSSETDPTAAMLLYTPYSQSQISMCNVTKGTGSSESTTEPPLLRVASGSWPGWATNEVAQCLYRGERSGGLNIEPPSGNQIDGQAADGGLIVRVDVCASGLEEDNCKLYSGGNYKPTGLLQKFGERSSTPIHFGLMTGSYKKNRSGGVLRKDISKVLGNTDSSLDEINSTTGQFINPGNNGIIDSLSRFRISKYDFGSRRYSDCNTYSITPSQLVEGSSTRGCSSWVNPLSEIYMEALRYFSSSTATTAASSAFYTDDAGYIASLPTPLSTFTNPMDNTNYCASCSIVVISTGLNSFDADQMASAANITGISGAADVNTKTNTVGNSSNENINGNSYLIGESAGVSTNQQCTAKTLNNLSDAKGICPEQPSLEGGYQLAGLAHHAHITDLRTDTVNFPDKQVVNTYSISLAESLPSFAIPVGSNTVTFSPHCESNTSGGATAGTTSPAWLSCSLANATIEDLAPDQSTGSMLFHWEDSSWGNDYDMDGVERIAWCVGAACGGGVSSNQIRITASTPLAAAGNALLFGYTITGSTADGVKRVVIRPGGTNFNDLYPLVGTGRYANTQTYTASGTAAALLKNPLWYAAKYGSFTDTNGNDIPDLVQEWDAQNNDTGASGSDGIPDNFFQVTNPAILETQLEKIFTDIVSRTSAGSALAVLATNTNSTGAVYQALYDPVSQVGTKSITWGGRVQALFVDDAGFFREDGDQDGTLDGYATDNIIQLVYSDTEEKTVLRRYTSVANFSANTYTEAALSTLKPIWNARDVLGTLDSASIDQQRPYTTAVGTSTAEGRHILTWIDSNVDGVLGSGEFTDFTTSSFTTDFGLLNTSDSTEANNIINYIRGKEISGFRSRTIDYNEDGIDEVWRLGDIIHSTPAAVAAPASAYDLIYNDPTYRTFSNQYSERREVIYTGANDGMLHAFNSGFYNNATRTFNLTNSGGTATSHPRGAELWAYVPFNLLPHLRWLTEADYPHVYYMDGPPKVYDVNIFTADADHPGGWGTILVAGMRFGGGGLTYDHDNDGTTPDITTRSAFVVMDITNPEVAPKLIAEITDPNLGFTTNVPTLAVKRVPGTGNDWANPSTNKWYLVFGSGPTDLDTATSSQNAFIYAYDLNANNLITVDTSVASSFVGNPKSADWETDFIDDVVYFGTVSGTESSPTGQLMRLRMDTIESSPVTSVMLNTSQPFVAAPTIAKDINFNKWVLAGTGRLFTSDDKGSNGQQSYYAVKEEYDAVETGVGTGVFINTFATTFTTSLLQNVTGVQVFEDSSVLDPNTLLPSGTDTFSELNTVIQGKSGWYRNFNYDGSSPSTRNLTSSVLLFEFVLFTTFDPPLVNACDADGSSNLFALDFTTGTANPGAGLGTDSSITNSGSYITLDNIDLGAGLASAPTPNPYDADTSNGTPEMGVNIQMSGGNTTNTNMTGASITGGRSGWREIFDF